MLKKILLASIFVITAITNVTHAEDDMKAVASKAYVDTKIETKQLKIPAAGQPNVGAGETVMTYTATGNGEIGERGLYSDISSYDATTDGDKLITASALNATFTNLPTTPTTKLECANSPACTLWTIVDQTAYGRGLPDGYIQRQYIYMMAGSYIKVEDLPISAGYRVEFDFQTTTLSNYLRNYIGGRAKGVSAGGGFRLSKLASGGTNLNRVVLYGFESGTEYYAPEQFQANTRYKYTYNNGVCTLESGGSVVSTRTFTVTDNTSTKWGINTYTSGNNYWQTDTDGIYVYSLKVWNAQGKLVMDLVPAIQQDTVPVVGFYNMVSGTFKTATAGEFTAGPEVN